jgi:hypothetical protein
MSPQFARPIPALFSSQIDGSSITDIRSAICDNTVVIRVPPTLGTVISFEVIDL